MDRVKICPVCHAEYYPDVLECADCHVALVWPGRHPVTEPLQDDGGWDQFEETEILGQVACDEERIIGIYRANLAREGIPSAILPTTRYQPKEVRFEYSVVSGNREIEIEAGQVPVGDILEGFRYDLFVRRLDWERATEMITELFPGLHPDQPDGFYHEYELGKCPACGAEVPEGATECPDCGLSLADPDEEA